MNRLSAFMSAGAHAFWFLVVFRILASFSPSRFFRVCGAFAAVVVSATAFTV
jgi:predicted MFS family arabinose efflux permease